MPNNALAEPNIENRICVRRPYYAYDNVDTTEPGHTTATLPTQNPTNTTPFELHEFVRHGAILGLTAAETTAYAHGHALARLTVEFAVFSEKAFARAFSYAYRPHLDTPEPDPNAYADPLPLDGFTIHPNYTATATATVTATPQQCAGHLHPVTYLVPAGENVELRAKTIHATPTARLIRIDDAVPAMIHDRPLNTDVQRAAHALDTIAETEPP